MGVYVGPGVSRLAVFCEDFWGDLVDGGDELEHVVLGEAFLGELALDGVARVCLAEHGVAVARDDLAGVQGFPEVGADDVLVGHVLGAYLVAEFEEPLEDLLVGAAVQGPREAVHAGGEREVRGGERGADEVGGVRADVAALVVCVDGEVESDEVVEVVALLGDAERAAEVLAVVRVGVHRRDPRAVLEDVAVYLARDSGQLPEQVHGVLVRVLPVLGLGHPSQVRARELRLALQRSDGHAELRHRMQVAGHVVQQLLNVRR